jgi:DNA ligase D-like protein (predicted ligase)
MPDRVEPMLATTGELPLQPDRWGLELKWDGVRAIAYVSGGKVRATGRRGTDVTDRYPELEALGDLLPAHDAVLDGEIVAFDGHGRPSFERLQQRMHVSWPERRLLRAVRVHYVVFDLLYLNGHPLFDLPYATRRELLDDLELAAGPIEAPPYLPGSDTAQVAELLDYTREQELEGLVVKRLDSRYRPGRRVDSWLKVKNFRTQEVVIGGWKPGRGRRAGGIGSLLLGVYDEGGRGLRFAGHVGTGFTDRMLEELSALLRPLRRRVSPYAEPVPRRFAVEAQWVEPRLVGEVAYTMWTAEGRLRAPSWRGLRGDVHPEDVHPEDLRPENGRAPDEPARPESADAG